MKKHLPFLHLALLVLLATACGEKKTSGDNFQGTLVYVQDIVVPQQYVDMGTTREKLMSMMKTEGLWADTVTVVYDGFGNYRLTMNNRQKVYKIYLADSNKLYTFVKTPEMEQCIVQEAVEYDLGTQAVRLSTELPVDTAVTINGIACATIRLRGTQNTVDYYYDSTQLRIKPALYARHRSEGFYDFLKKSRSLPMGIRRRNGGIELVQTLVESRPGPADAKIFRLPVLELDSSLNAIKMPGVEVRKVRRGL